MKLLKTTSLLFLLGFSTSYAFTVNAGSDRKTLVRSSPNYYMLDPFGSTNLTSPYSEAWTYTLNGTQQTVTASGTFPTNTVGTVQMTYTVTDSSGISVSDTMNIEVFPIPTTLHTNLVAHYPFDGNVQDMQPNAYHGISFGNLVYSGLPLANPNSYKATNRYIEFDGINDYVKLAQANSLLENQTDFTISYWILPLQSQKTSFLSKRAVCTTGRAFDMRGQGAINFESTEAQNRGGTKVVIPQEKWSLVTVTKQGNNYSHYINGEIKAVTTLQGLSFTDGDLSFSNSPCIGVDGTTRSNGGLDDFRIYDRVLNTLELNQLYLDTHPDPSMN
jgi:hypothetical protein